MKAAYFAEKDAIQMLLSVPGVRKDIRNKTGQTFEEILSSYSAHMTPGKKLSLETAMLIESKK